MGRAHEVRAASMAKTALMKSKKYSKWGKEIFQAAKSGVPDPEMNQTLKNTIAKAKKDQCPADVIKRAIEKAAGLTSGAMKEATYEGMGNGNVAVIVECLTDNVNRTVTTVRSAFTKTGGTFGASASYMFERKAYFKFTGMSEDEALEALLNAGVDVSEVSTDEAGYTIISADPSQFQEVSDALNAANPDIDYDTNEVAMVPNAKVTLTPEQQEKFMHMLDLLRESEDVQNIYYNADINEDDIEE